MPKEAVAYLDVLGFSNISVSNPERAIAVLDELSLQLADPVQNRQYGWTARYALSDSIFLTQPNLSMALRTLRNHVFNLVTMTCGLDPTTGDPGDPVLPRGALAFGEVRHVASVFLPTKTPANLVGPAVVEAVTLEKTPGLKGPRLVVPDSVVTQLKVTEPQLVDWILRRFTPDIWEVLWPLPLDPAAFEQDETWLRQLATASLRLCERYGTSKYGVHYREFLLLIARSVQRAIKFGRAGRLTSRLGVDALLLPEEVRRVCEGGATLPYQFLAEVADVVPESGVGPPRWWRVLNWAVGTCPAGARCVDRDGG